MKQVLFLGCAALLTLGLLAGCAAPMDDQTEAERPAALIPRPLPVKDVAANPYMADSDNSIHNDVYATDVTDGAAPMGICSQVSVSLETQNIHAPSAAFLTAGATPLLPSWGVSPLRTWTGT